MSEQNHKHRWAIILAGGDGTRFKPLTRTLGGDDRPKQFCAALRSATEEQVLKRLYSEIISTNFSKEVLAQRQGDLSVMQVSGVGWTDLGEPQRVVSTLQSNQFYHRTAGLCSPAT